MRERLEDILPLCQHFLSQFNEKYGQQKRFDISAFTEMEGYSWPGNIRELKNTVERLCILTEGNSISSYDVKQLLDMNGPRTRQTSIDTGEGHSEKRIPHHQPESRTVQSLFDEYSKQNVFDALKRTNGNKTATARLLGISRGKLYRLLEEIQ